MSEDQRVEMLSPEASLEMAATLGLHERVAELDIFRTLFHRPRTAKAISDLLLSLLLDADLSEFIAGLDHCPRLNEDGGAGVGDIVDDAADVLSGFGFNRDNVTALALGDDWLLRDTPSPWRLEDGVQLFQQPATGIP